MAAHGYQQFNARVTAHYRRQEFAAAYDLLTAEGGQYPEQEAEIAYLRSCMAARIGRPDLAIQIIEEALGRGHWYGEMLLRQSPSWQVLQGLPAFERVAAACIALQREAQAPAQHFVALPPLQTPPYRALIALHGNGDNGKRALEGWRAVADEGWLLASIQSSQIVQANGYVWDDEETARCDILEQYAALAAAYPLAPDHQVIAGFSMGAEMALRAALSGDIAARGFILLGPGGPNTGQADAWLPLIEARQRLGTPLRGYLLLGEEDTETPLEGHRRLTDLLGAHGIPCGFEVLPGLGHEYPPEFGPMLRRALAFIDSE